MLISITFLLLSLSLPTLAYPVQLSCDTQGSWVSGGTPDVNLGQMFSGGVLSDGNVGSRCVISGLPSLGFEQCAIYTVTVSSSVSLGHKIAASLGTMGNSATHVSSGQTEACRNSQTRRTSTSYSWRAPATGATTTVSALCGGYNYNVFAAAPVAVHVDYDLYNVSTTQCLELGNAVRSGAYLWVVVMAAVAMFLGTF